MKVLIAVVSCQKNAHRRKAQRDTWAKENIIDIHGVDAHLFSFIGIYPPQPHTLGWLGDDDPYVFWVDSIEGGDSYIITRSNDRYDDLPEKVRAICQFALNEGYDGIWRVDDDVYLRPERLTIPDADYAGRVRGPSMGLPAPYCSGFCYWLSRRAMQAIVDTPFNCQAEDCMVGNILLKHGMEPVDLGDQIVVVRSKKSAISGNEGPRQGNAIIASCEYEPDEMLVAHEEFLKAESVPYPKITLDDPELSRVDILLKTFLRDPMLFRAIGNIKDHLPSARMVIVDDGEAAHQKTSLYAKLKWAGHAVKLMPFDSGFGEKSNAAIPLYKRDYVLIASDDFCFTPEVAEGVRKMVRFLDKVPQYGVVSGRVNRNPYEFDLERKGTTIREEKADRKTTMDLGSGPEEVIICDLTVNFSLIRRKVFEEVRWDGGKVKIGGGEHGAYFMDLREAGWGVACIPSVNINELNYFTGCQDPRYPSYRARARHPGRPCLKKRGIDFYHCHGHKDPEVC